MGTLTGLARQDEARRALPLQAKQATIRSTPASASDPVYVTIDGQSVSYKRGPCHGWAPRYEVVQPAGPTPLHVTDYPGDGERATLKIASGSLQAVDPPDGATELIVTPVFPRAGDPCVVIETAGPDSTQLVIVAWWPDV